MFRGLRALGLRPIEILMTCMLGTFTTIYYVGPPEFVDDPRMKQKEDEKATEE